MASETSTAEWVSHGGVMRKRHHFYISAYWFASNLLWGALLVIIIPSQMREFAPTDPGRPLGLLLGLGAVPALVVPLLAGPLSDRCRSRLGRRRPYMIVGSTINMLGLAMLWLGASRINIAAFFAGYLLTNIGNYNTDFVHPVSRENNWSLS